jgi:hypothetical protein
VLRDEGADAAGVGEGGGGQGETKERMAWNQEGRARKCAGAARPGGKLC